MRPRIERGPVVIIGGAEDREGGAEILREFVRLAGGARARIGVIAAASEIAHEIAADYVALFRRLGAAWACDLKIDSRRDADRDATLDAAADSTGVFFTGGNQLRLTQTLGGTKLDALLRGRRGDGMALAGTSAGAAMMSNSMILGGGGEENPRAEAVRIGPGMDLLVGAMIDTHFSQRGRHGRLLTAVAHYPQDLGLGIDENTALVVDRTEFEVIGEGAVTVIDGGAMTYTNLPYVEECAGLALYGVSVHVLSAGHRFDLANRRPIVPDDDGTARSSKRSNSGATTKKRPQRTKGK